MLKCDPMMKAPNLCSKMFYSSLLISISNIGLSRLGPLVGPTLLIKDGAVCTDVCAARRAQATTFEASGARKSWLTVNFGH